MSLFTVTLVPAQSILQNMGSMDPKDCRRLVDDATSRLQQWPACWQGLDEQIDSQVAGFSVESDMYILFLYFYGITIGLTRLTEMHNRLL